ncbi:MAG: zinc-binding dehydrogenase, partial [Pseudomonadota bacterium]|nr:zinc-binding dehydrogenase [Pseudomonadota bacterium]
GLRALAFRGRIVIVGFSSGAISEVRGNYLLYNGLTVMGAPLDINFDLLPTEIRAGTGWWLDLLAQKHISANVTETYPFDQIGTALARLLGRQARGKIVLDMS